MTARAWAVMRPSSWRGRRIPGLSGALLALATVNATASAQEAAVNTLTRAERDAGWRLLFDGHSLDQWRGYQRPDMPDGWQVVEGLLTRVSRAGDIITRDTFANFEFAFEFNVEPGGNSGVFYRATESPDLIYHVAPEFQILDDERHRDGASPLTSTGAAYGLVPAPAGVTKPAGEWNGGRIVVRGDSVEHWLNGQRVAAYDRSSEDFRRRVAASKFAEWPGFGLPDRGHLGLQDHGSRVMYRNLKVRPLD